MSRSISSVHIKKIGHNLKEIRERGLLSLVSKLKYGFTFDEELAGSKELLIYLFKWFQYDNPSYQEEALETLLSILKSPSGLVLIKLIGPKRLLNDLANLKEKVHTNLVEFLENIIEFVKAQTHILNKENIDIPTLNMPLSLRSDHIEVNTEFDVDSISKDTKVTYKDNTINLDAKTWNELDNEQLFNLPSQGIKIYLMPWVQLCESDVRKIMLNEECICASDSIERAAYFFNHILLNDFPPDVFLNRPATVKAFQTMINSSKYSVLSMEAISLFCDSINMRVQQLYDPSLRHCKKSPFNNCEDWKTCSDRSKYVSHLSINSATSYCDPTTALNQLPLPVFCLDVMYTIVNLFNETISQSTREHNETHFSLKEMNVAFTLKFKLLRLLRQSIDGKIWKSQDTNRFTQEIIQKIVQLLRSCGDVLNKFRLACLTSEIKDPLHRMCYVRMLIFCIYFAHWCDYTPILPRTLITNLFSCLDDISFSFIYPKLHEKLYKFLEFQQYGSLEDQNKLKTYKNIKDIAESMKSAIFLLQNFDTQSKHFNVIETIKISLTSLEFHKNVRLIANVLEIFCLKLSKWSLSIEQWQDIKNITLILLAHNCVWVQESFYAGVRTAVVNVLGGLIKTNDELKLYQESSLKFIIDTSVLMEICSFGLESKSKKVKDCAKDIIQHLVRGKLLMSDTMWRISLEAILPTLPILHTYAAHDNEFGKSVIKTLDLKIGECMLIPKIEIIKGNIRLLYSKCFTAQMEGSKNLMKFLYLDEENDKLLPNSDCIRADIFCSTVKSVSMKNFNVNKPQDPNFYEEGALLQVMNLLKFNVNTSAKRDSIQITSEKDDEFSQVDPSFCRSALAQLAVMLQQTNLHEIFYAENGCETVVKHYLRSSLVSSEFTTFPESAMSCISILNSLCYNSTTIRHWASEEQDLLLDIIRAILLFPSEENFVTMASQVLGLLSFSHHIITSQSSQCNDEYWTNNLSLHHTIASKMNLPFRCASHSRTSQYQMENKEDWMMKQSSISGYLRLYWSVVWYGGLDKVLRWPYVPETTNNEDFNQTLMIKNSDLSLLKASSPIQGCVSALYQIQNATTHKAVNYGIDTLIGYILLNRDGESDMLHFDALPWCGTLRRFLLAPPASPKDLLLLLHFMELLPLYLELFEKNCGEFTEVSWVIESILDAPFGICALLKKDDADDWIDSCDLFSFKLKQKIIEFICECCKFCNKLTHNHKNGITWNNVIYHLSDCLSNLQINNMNSLAYAGQIVECLTHLMNSPNHGLKTDDDRNKQKKLVYNLVNLCESLHVKEDRCSYKGFSLVFNSLSILSRLLDILPDDSKENIHILYWIEKAKCDVLFVCQMWQKSNHLMLRTLSLKVLSGMVASGLTVNVQKRYQDIKSSITEVAVEILVDLTESSLLREQAAILLCNLLATKNSLTSKNSNCDIKQDLLSLLTPDFYSKIAATLTKVCLNEVDELDSGENIPLGFISNREKYEVVFSKNSVNNIPVKLSVTSLPKCTIGLLTSISNVVYNILILCDEVSEDMCKSGIFRILFRCITLKISPSVNKYSVCASVCRTLYRAVELSQEVHTVLLNTQDCVNALLELFIDDYLGGDIDSENVIASHADMWRWAFLLLGCLVETPQGYNYVWEIVSDVGLMLFFHSLLTSISDSKYKDIIPSALYCLVSLLNSYTSYHNDANVNLETFLDTTGTRKFDSTISKENSNCSTNSDQIHDLSKLAESENRQIKSKRDCLKNAVLSEEFCFYLLELYCKYNTSDVEKRVNGKNFDCVASGLCNMLGISDKAKMLAVNFKFTERLIENLNEIQYTLMTSVKPQTIIRNRKKSPLIHYLNWSLLMLCNVVSNCDAAKDVCVESNLVTPINKLWPWILSSEMLRFHTIQLLSSYTNSCPKASNTMCATVGTHSLLSEVIELVLKEMNLVSRSHPLVTLEGCLQILKNVSCHIHCRTIIVKSEIFACLNKMHPAITKRQPQWKKVEIMWESFCAIMSKYPEGQSKIAEYTGALCAFVHQADGLMLTVIRNCAFNSMNRPRFLASAELLHLFSNILTCQRPLVEKTCVCTAIWALCANNHKSKLSMKTVGITARLADCLQRLESDSGDENECEIQIMTYVLNVIKVA